MAAPSTYNFRLMDCIGKIRVQPRGMHNDYVFMGLRLVSFLSKRRDGVQVQSLGWNQYFGQTQRAVAEQMRAGQYGGSSVWYSGPLFTVMKNGRQIVSTNADFGYNSQFVLTVVASSTQRDRLQGTLSETGTVVGNTVYDLACEAAK